jgi:hypothetical protein
MHQSNFSRSLQIKASKMYLRAQPQKIEVQF